MTYFPPSETQCKCGCGLDIKTVLRNELDRTREKLGFPIRVLSGARCKNHNIRVGGVPNSYHTLGLAADLAFPTDHDDRQEMIRAFTELRYGGLGFYDDFLHVDLRHITGKPRAYWTGK